VLKKTATVVGDNDVLDEIQSAEGMLWPLHPVAGTGGREEKPAEVVVGDTAF
jgi:hypothetical protein